MPPFEPCEKLQSLRKEIDSFDQQLAKMLCQRLKLIHQAAPLKPRQEDVRLENRIEDIITKILPIADQEDVPKDYLESVYRYLIEASIQSEAREWQKLNLS